MRALKMPFALKNYELAAFAFFYVFVGFAQHLPNKPRIPSSCATVA